MAKIASPAAAVAPPELPRLVLAQAVRTALGNICSDTLDGLVRGGYLPPPLRLGPRLLAWDAADVAAAVEKLKRQAREGATHAD